MSRRKSCASNWATPRNLFQSYGHYLASVIGAVNWVPARQLGDQLLSLARREQDSLWLLEAHHTLWAILLDMGELASTKDHAEQGFMLYDRGRHGQLDSVYGGHDAGVCSQIHAAKADGYSAFRIKLCRQSRLH